MNLAEFTDHLFYLFDKAGPLGSQLQITTVSNPVQRRSQNRSPGLHPVILCLPDRIPSLRKYIREEIWKKTALRVINTLDIGYHPHCNSVSDRTYHGIQTDVVKVFAERFRSDPVISQEHHGFFAVGMDNVHQVFGQPADLYLLKFDKVPEFLRRNAEG